MTVVMGLCSIAAMGAEFSRKQTGTTTIANGSTTATVSITAVDMSKSFLVFSSTLDDNSTTNFQVGGEITNTTTLTFQRTGNTGTVSISWQVFEFESGVFVQHGSSTNVARNTNVNVAISCIDLTKSFVLISARKSGSSLGNDDGITANLTSSTNLQLFIAGTAGADMEEAYWQVIEYQGAVVKKVTASITGTATSTTSTITPAVTNLAKTMVVSNHTISTDISANNLPRTELTNTTTVTYTRVGNTSMTMNFVTYVVEFTDQTTVTRGTQAFASGATTQNVTITSATSSGVIGTGNYGRQGSTNYASDDNAGHVWFTYRITTSTNLQIQRAVGTGSTANAPWQIVTFQDTGEQQNTFYSRASGAWESNTSWSFSSDGSSGAVPTGVYPRRTNNVVIQNGHNITANSVTDNNPCSVSADGLGRANVGTFTGSNDQMFYHTGDIIIANGGTLTVTEELLIEGYTLVENGGTLTVSEDIINLGYLEIASTANFSNTDDLILSGSSVTIIDNLSFGADDIYIDHTEATLCGQGIMNLGNGGVDPTIQFFNGGSLNQVCSTFSVTCTSNCGAFPITPTGNFSFGYVGPGGVGNSVDNVLWLRANSGTSTTTNGSSISSWNDQSGNTNHALQATGAQQPQFQSSVINGQPTILFDNASAGSNDELVVADNSNLDNTTGLTILSVARPLNLNGAARAIVSKRAAFNDNASYSSFFLSGNNLNTDIDLGNNRFTSATAFANSTNYIISTLYDGTLAAASRVRVYVNGGLDVTATESSTSIPNYASNLTIGSLNTGDGRAFGGHIAEVIIFRRSINEAERVIASNYLSAKYDITISANDVYTMDNSGNGNYDFDVAGIGQASNGSNDRDARGSGMVRMWNPKDLGNSEFLMWGHDNVALASSTTSGVAAPIQERLSRTWRVSESGDVGNVSISFDFSGVGGSPIGSNLRLLIDRDGDGFGDNDVTPIVGSVSNGIAVFSNINFQNGDRFTLGNTDASTPLPISLVSFEALPSNEMVLVKWKTESELNNDEFTVEKSTDAERWEEVTSVAGAGTTKKIMHYQILDHHPIEGKSYYRLKQTDFDGKFEYSPIVAVEFKGHTALLLSPNPTNGLFTIRDQRLSLDQIRVFNAQGMRVRPMQYLENGRLQVDLSSFSSGVYIIQVSDGVAIRSARLVKY